MPSLQAFSNYSLKLVSSHFFFLNIRYFCGLSFEDSVYHLSLQNQLLDLIENKLIWVLSFIPGLAATLPNLMSKLHNCGGKYISASPVVVPDAKVLHAYALNLNIKAAILACLYFSKSDPFPLLFLKVKRWDSSIASIWSTVVWLCTWNFFNKIATATAQSYLKGQQEKELKGLANNISSSTSMSNSVEAISKVYIKI